MNSLLIVNLIAFAAVTAYAVYLFIYLIRTRAAYIRLGKRRISERHEKTLRTCLGECVWAKETAEGQEERHHSCAVFLWIYFSAVRSP